MQIRGYAAVFNQPTKFGGRMEVIRPGAFSKMLADKTHDIIALYDHKVAPVLGRRKNGTLRLEEDQRGLKIEIDLPNTTAGRDVYESVGRGDVDGGSFHFLRRSLIAMENGVRVLKELWLDEVTVTHLPVYTGTSMAARSKSGEIVWAPDTKKYHDIIANLK